MIKNRPVYIPLLSSVESLTLSNYDNTSKLVRNNEYVIICNDMSLISHECGMICNDINVYSNNESC